MRCSMKTRFKIILLIVLVALGALLISRRGQITELVQGWQQPELPEAVSYEEVQEGKFENRNPQVETNSKEEIRNEKNIENGIEDEDQGVEIGLNLPEAEEEGVEGVEGVEETSDLPKEINLAVPFTPQAPYANWELPYQEACEEASVYMVHEYYQGTPGGRIAAETADAVLLQIVDYEKVLFGDYLDTTAAQTATLAEQMYGYERVELIENPTVEQIKEQVAAGRPVIVPAAGQQLRNPFFTQPGPLYHMLVIRGYTGNSFITNDPGTRRGEGYTYSFETIMNAMHDWNGGDVENGAKVVIVIWPEN